MADLARRRPEEQHGLRPRQYLLLGLILTVITILELYVSYSGLGIQLMTVTLILLSAIKFGLVVAFFMHLRFENALLTRLFVFCFGLAAAVIFSLLALFGGDLQ